MWPNSNVRWTMFGMLCTSESISRRCLGMSMNLRSDWLMSGAKLYRHCYQIIIHQQQLHNRAI